VLEIDAKELHLGPAIHGVGGILELLLVADSDF